MTEKFPGYDVLGQVDTWDDVTKGVVLRRLGPPPPIRFFSPEEEAVVRPMVERLLGLDDAPKCHVVEELDAKLTEHVGPGFRHDDMPEDWDTWRQSVHALDEDARKRHGKGFGELDASAQRAMLEYVRTADGDWHGLPASKVWGRWMSDLCTIFYAHPLVWNEIGFGGPAYPRGYKAHSLQAVVEPWEVPSVDALDPVRWAGRLAEAHERQK